MYNVVDMEEDSTDHLSHGSGTRPDPHVYHQELGDTSDVLPGIWNRVLFDSTTKPSSRDRQNKSTRIAVSNIHVVGDTVICDVTLDGSVGVGEGSSTPYAARQTLSVRPNPANAHAVVRLAPFSGRAELRVFDSSGREVLAGESAAGNSAAVFSLDLGRLSSGVYLLRCGFATQTLVVTR
jgi:hypothetical protein